MLNLTRRDFIKTATAGIFAFNALGFLPDNRVFAADNCTVKTRYGKFRGFLDKNGVRTWLGIPYAKPPVGKLRWRAPQSLKPSNRTFDAKDFGFTAVQSFDKHEAASQNPQSEDCLTLNICTRSEKKNKPVMVFIHGGGFQNDGSSDPLYNCANFAAAHDLVFVTINYRLNVFGFVNFAVIDPSFEDSAYLGIKDQVAALKWVKENIEEFGGNPDNITIFGESAGAASVVFLSVLPAAKGLFQKAIPQSGNAYMYKMPETYDPIPEAYMKLSGAKNMSDMMKKSPAELIKIYDKISDPRVMETELDYLPLCDGKYLPRNPLVALREGGAHGIKFLTGTTSDEWRYWLLFIDDFFKKYRADLDNLSPVIPKYALNNSRRGEEFYKAWLAGRPDTEENFIEFVDQLDWRVGQELMAEAQSYFDDVYYYLFSEQSTIEELRSCHAVDLPFTFNMPDEIMPNPNPELVRQVQTAWAAFASTGNPANEFIPHWERYSADNRQTMELNLKGCVCHRDLNTQNLNSLRFIYEN